MTQDVKYAIEVAIVTMSSVWPEDFLKVFTADELHGMLERTRPDEDFAVEKCMREAWDALQEKETR